MNAKKNAAPVLQHRNGKTKAFDLTFGNLIVALTNELRKFFVLVLALTALLAFGAAFEGKANILVALLIATVTTAFSVVLAKGVK